MRPDRAVLGIVVLAAIAGLRHRQRQPGSGDDDVDGGSGHDAVDYVANPTGADVDLAIAGPQLKGSGADTFAGIEDVYGTRGETSCAATAPATSWSASRATTRSPAASAHKRVAFRVLSSHR
jgi:hypothetical protein